VLMLRASAGARARAKLRSPKKNEPRKRGSS
jgi:hypothetical protein